MRFRWGVFGTGAVSAKFIAGLRSARQAELGFVASRSLQRAQALVAAAGAGRAVEGYEAALSDPGVDAVYIATPPSEHLRHALMCIAVGVPVLVEKPFAATAEEARRIAEAARAGGVFAMEAMWTRFLPAAQALRAQLAAQAIGEPRLLTGNFCLSQRPEPGGIFDSRLGGGALAHLGAYPLSLGQWLLGTPEVVQAMATTGPGGVDEDAAFQLRYPGGAMASFCVSLRSWAPDAFRVSGTHGSIALRGAIVRPEGLDILRLPPRPAEEARFDLRARLRDARRAGEPDHALG
ncbi:Gfo/Idh/MocA family oxidoreductase [Xylophilus rhododendri]|uniref:Gfo/Idh/MocA family oxidoreductase n=1 Tax=Xylophilus rhododendri TaxID=2697032 RepID=A0A857J5M7_9BURK|nr:Gfo/Idh/MocA family oxidoreductase [Xylophilus rhododendri]QHI98145.1 Gfo/Idh/MocA family oxidoreductase [Xylophilus rhododendri]